MTFQISDFEQWCSELGISMDVLRESAGVKKSRATKMRMKKEIGGALVRKRLMAAALRIEMERPTRTPTGTIVVGVREIGELAEKLATLDREMFLRALENLRRLVSGAEAAKELGVRRG